MREQLATLITERIESERDKIRKDFLSGKAVKTRFAVIDDFLPVSIARKIFISFPAFKEMQLFDNFQEKKYVSKDLEKYKPVIADIIKYFQTTEFVKKIAELTEIKGLQSDLKLQESRICAMAKGHFMNPHLDSSHHQNGENYRVLNVIYYCTPDWKTEYGGNLEIWNESITEAIEIPSLFNRLVLMATDNKAWHSVNKVRKDSARCNISSYYFSPQSPNDFETKHATRFKARPEQKFRRILTKVGSNLQMILKKVKKNGISKKDIYKSDK